MSPRERADRQYAGRRSDMIGEQQPSETSGGAAKTIALFAVVAIPLGLLISSFKTRQQMHDEKTAFRQLGLDWEKRFQHPK